MQWRGQSRRCSTHMEQPGAWEAKRTITGDPPAAGLLLANGEQPVLQRPMGKSENRTIELGNQEWAIFTLVQMPIFKKWSASVPPVSLKLVFPPVSLFPVYGGRTLYQFMLLRKC